jgi:hypothetical protein
MTHQFEPKDIQFTNDKVKDFIFVLFGQDKNMPIKKNGISTPQDVLSDEALSKFIDANGGDVYAMGCVEGGKLTHQWHVGQEGWERVSE